MVSRWKKVWECGWKKKKRLESNFLSEFPCNFGFSQYLMDSVNYFSTQKFLVMSSAFFVCLFMSDNSSQLIKRGLHSRLIKRGLSFVFKSVVLEFTCFVFSCTAEAAGISREWNKMPSVLWAGGHLFNLQVTSVSGHHCLVVIQ